MIRNVVSFPDLPRGLDGFRLLQLGDLHLDLDPRLADVTIDLLTGLKFDLAIITGDYRNSIKDDYEPAIEPVARIVAASDSPVFGILGNHDFIAMVDWLEGAGLRMLLNYVVVHQHGGECVAVCGVDDSHFYNNADVPAVGMKAGRGEFLVLLNHSPDLYREAAEGFRLMLSGHTHDGQICLPGGFALIKLAEVPRRMWAGAWGTRSFGDTHREVPAAVAWPPGFSVHRRLRFMNFDTADEPIGPQY